MLVIKWIPANIIQDIFDLKNPDNPVVQDYLPYQYLFWEIDPNQNGHTFLTEK